MKHQHLLLASVALALTIHVHAQPVIGIQRAAGGSTTDFFTCMIVTTDGGMLAGGSSYSNISGDKTANSWNGSSDYWIVKYDAAGNIQWDKTIGFYTDDNLNEIAQTIQTEDI